VVNSAALRGNSMLYSILVYFPTLTHFLSRQILRFFGGRTQLFRLFVDGLHRLLDFTLTQADCPSLSSFQACSTIRGQRAVLHEEPLRLPALPVFLLSFAAAFIENLPVLSGPILSCPANYLFVPLIS
jgi:hypothetical protein